MSRVPVPPDSEFTLANLPFGIFSPPGGGPRAGMAIGDRVVDLAALARAGVIAVDPAIFERPYLNDFIALGKPTTGMARAQGQRWLANPQAEPEVPGSLFSRTEVKMHLPVRIGDYTDFYSSIDHATNVGKLFRDPDRALLPNWRHLPIGYHGRASSIVVSGTDVRRPRGQVLRAGSEQPAYLPTERLDFELELAFIVGRDSILGRPVPVGEAEDYIFGLVLFNDWSARDIQQWEYRPLGPFLGKSFASSMSPWVVPLEALEPFRVAAPPQDPEVLPYLRSPAAGNFSIELGVQVNERTVCRTNFRRMYWSMAQQLAHHSSNGCNLRVGDVMASGTISGSTPGSYGSLLEITRNGELGPFLQDGDRVTLRGHAGEGPARVGFGEVTATILPA